MVERFVREHWVTLLAAWMLLFLAGLGANAYYARESALMEAVKGAKEQHAEIIRKCE